MIRLFNRVTEKANRRRLRKESTEAEKLLWSYLRNKKLNNLKFKRQFSVRKYVIDFYCPSRKLAIELDGDIHLEKQVREHDEIRDNYLRSLRIQILRINNQDVFNDIYKVLDKIQQAALIINT